MKKRLTILMSSLLLTACTSQNDNTVEQTPPSKEESATEADVTQQQTQIPENKSPESDNTATSSLNKEGTDFPEYSILLEKAGSENNHIRVETDNPGNRILFAENENGEKKYKSILVKKKSLLKIIDLTSNKMIYNHTISL